MGLKGKEEETQLKRICLVKLVVFFGGSGGGGPVSIFTGIFISESMLRRLHLFG